MSRTTHFELPADEPERAIAFYEAALGWKFAKWDNPLDYWVISTGDPAEPGIDGGLYPREKAGQGVSTVASVDDLDAAVERVRAAGGTVNMARAPIPGVGWYASCRDTEGNVFGLMQSDPDAA